MDIKEYYGFIYITTCKVNGKKYIGQKKFNRDWEDYLGSGTILKRAIKLYGKDNFDYEVLYRSELFEDTKENKRLIKKHLMIKNNFLSKNIIQ